MRILKQLALCLLLLSCPALSSGKPDKDKPDDPRPQEKLTSQWLGIYSYGENVNQDPVKFNLILIQSGKTVVGFIKEPNTFGLRRAPWLHAVIKGCYEEATGKVAFKKTYDGTAGVGHDVEYKGKLSKDGARVEGNWEINDVGSTFKLERVPSKHLGSFSGVYSGSYSSSDEKRQLVKFNLILIQDGRKVTGFMKEQNALGGDSEPWLHASFHGQMDDTGKLSGIKTDDGTSREDKVVEYQGQLSRDRMKVQGTLKFQEKLTGSFNLERLRLDDTTLESIK